MKTTDFIQKQSKIAADNNIIPLHFYKEYNVKTGLRNENGTGVLVGLSQVSNVIGYEVVDGVKHSIDGSLVYRGYEIGELIRGFQKDKRHGFEEIIYLLIFGELPDKETLWRFKEHLGNARELPGSFVENMILKNPSNNIMNKLQRSILVLYSYDEDPEDPTIENIIKESLDIIAKFPTIVAYGYQAKAHYYDGQSLIIHQPRPDLSTAEYLLYLIRPDQKFTAKEAEVLDMCLLLHADHGANNSSFATHVLASSGTDTYSALAAAVGSLKGPKHGGANIYVTDMIDYIKETCNYKDEAALKKCLEDILDKKVHNKSGLIYGMGHAVYTKSDPRAEWLRDKAWELAVEGKTEEEYMLYFNVEKLTKQIFKERKNVDICANVDLYSGYVYSMLKIPRDLYTPIFAISRVAGWVAHRIEQLMSDKKIIRPAYQFVLDMKDYKELDKR